MSKAKDTLEGVEAKMVGDTWRDDGILCCAVAFTKGGETLVHEAYLIGHEGIGALTYMDESPRARKDFAGHVAIMLEDEADLGEGTPLGDFLGATEDAK